MANSGMFRKQREKPGLAEAAAGWATGRILKTHDQSLSNGGTSLAPLNDGLGSKVTPEADPS